MSTKLVMTEYHQGPFQEGLYHFLSEYTHELIYE